MDAMALIHCLHEHRAAVNTQLREAATKLSEQSLRQSFDIGQGSIWKSLLHLYAAEYVWLAALEGEQTPLTPGDLPGKIPGNQQGPDAIETLAELCSRWTELEKRWGSYLKTLTAAQLDDLVTKANNSGQIFQTRRADVLLHVCTHAQYTVAQVLNMLRHVGHTPLPDVMLISLARRQMLERGQSK